LEKSRLRALFSDITLVPAAKSVVFAAWRGA
jgi:hypothetical protein